MRRWIFRLGGAAQAAPFCLWLALFTVLLYGAAGPAWEPLVLQLGQLSLTRVIGSHFVHSDLTHLLWNTGALIVLGLAFERLPGFRPVPVLAAGVAAVAGWFAFAGHGFVLYCGLSGLLNALLAAGLLHWWRLSRDPLAVIMAALSLAKIGLELQLGDALLATSSWQAAPQAHLAGWAGGFLLSLWQFGNTRYIRTG